MTGSTPLERAAARCEAGHDNRITGMTEEANPWTS
jgi:hypothetical protein